VQFDGGFLDLPGTPVRDPGGAAASGAAVRAHAEDLFGGEVHAEGEPADRLAAQFHRVRVELDQNSNSRGLSIASSGAVTTIGTVAAGEPGSLIGVSIASARVSMKASASLVVAGRSAVGSRRRRERHALGHQQDSGTGQTGGDLGEHMPGEPFDLTEDRQQGPERGVCLDVLAGGGHPDADDHVVLGEVDRGEPLP
jgi:hypothetical protein